MALATETQRLASLRCSAADWSQKGPIGFDQIAIGMEPAGHRRGFRRTVGKVDSAAEADRQTSAERAFISSGAGTAQPMHDTAGDSGHPAGAPVPTSSSMGQQRRGQ